MKLVPIIVFFVAFAFAQGARGDAVPMPTVPSYALTIALDPSQHRLSVSGRITIPAGVAGDPQLLHLSSKMRDLRISLRGAGGAATPLTLAEPMADASGDRIFHLPAAPAPGRPLELDLSYTSTNTNGLVFSLRGPTYFAGGPDLAWYPQFGSEKRGVGSMTFRLPDNLTVIASGARQADGRTFLLTAPLHLSFVAGEYRTTRVDGPIPVVAYNLKPRPGMAGYVRHAQAILSLLAREFGPYPFHEFAIVEVPAAEANGAGFSGASLEGIILADEGSFDSGFSLPFYAHELGHQWWGNLVTNSGPGGNDMLDEAMAQWGALTVVRKTEGAKAAETFRRSGYPGYAADQSGKGYLTIAAAGLDHRLSDLPNGYISHEIADSKGFLVYNQLDREIGHERFSRALRSITKDYAYRDLTWPEFLKRVQTASGRNLSELYAEWFDRPGAPSFEPRWTQNGRIVDLEVRQPAPAYTMTTEALLKGKGNGRKLITFRLRGPVTHVRLPLPFHLTSVEIDPSFEAPHWTEAYRAEADALALVTAAQMKTGTLAEVRRNYSLALGGVRQPDLWGATFLAERGLATCDRVEGKWEGVRDHLTRALAQPSRPPAILPWAYESLAQAYQHLGDRTAMESAIAAAIAADAMLAKPTGAGLAARALTTSAP